MMPLSASLPCHHLRRPPPCQSPGPSFLYLLVPCPMGGRAQSQPSARRPHTPPTAAMCCLRFFALRLMPGYRLNKLYAGWIIVGDTSNRSGVVRIEDRRRKDRCESDKHPMDRIQDRRCPPTTQVSAPPATSSSRIATITPKLTQASSAQAGPFNWALRLV